MTPRGVCQFVLGPLVALFVIGPALDWTAPGGPDLVAAWGTAASGQSSGGSVQAAPARAPEPEPAVALPPPAERPPPPSSEPPKPAALAPSGAAGCVGSAAAAFTQGAADSGSGGTAPVMVRRGTGRRVPVANSSALTAALASARPGDTIELADGRYAGQFKAAGSGTAANPIALVGSCRAILDGGGTGAGYALHLNGANHWRLSGFTVTGAQKGVMTDRSNNTVLSHLTVGNTGMEAVHFGNFSSNNVVQSSMIHNTGKANPKFGEGVYFGTAKSNWGSKSGGQPDASNNNRALGNSFRAITGENIDVKEATSGGVIAGNTFDGSGISGANFADSVLDMKGVRYRVLNNRTSGASASLKNGFQTHVITDPATSGCNNTFTNNTFPGLTFSGEPIQLDKKCGGDS
ncbi:hypothetical protein [Pseudonocardia acaciae]|uniref:hypothetical protein n=1 Tax=Pseudonocardia acaciae TaxID=551276 RepID=UPI00068591A4|nr:hypothetical protein [Pseudonocardia acaciae]